MSGVQQPTQNLDLPRECYSFNHNKYDALMTAMGT